MITVEIVADSKFPVDRKIIRARVEEVLSQEGLRDDVVLSILIVGKRKMAELSKQYMGELSPTDVLSFPLNDPSDSSPFVASPDGLLRLGDVVVCYSIAREEAIEKQMLLDTKIADLIEHGLRHLLGKHHR